MILIANPHHPLHAVLDVFGLCQVRFLQNRMKPGEDDT
jgi:hypothetical protein